MLYNQIKFFSLLSAQSVNFRFSMKFIIGLLFVLSALESRDCKTMSWGNLQPRNLLLFDQFFHQKHATSGVICRPFEFSSKHGSLITAIHITDLTPKQNGGYVRIMCGGIGFNFVKLLLISENNKQLLLNVELFGS